MSSEKIRAIERHFEHVPYGNNSLSSEIHGIANQTKINAVVKNLVMMTDVAMQDNNMELAESLKAGVYKISKQLDILKNIKEEYVMDLRTRSNWTDHGWDDNFFTENGQINLDDNMTLHLTAFHTSTHGLMQQTLEDRPVECESVGYWMQQLMKRTRDI